MSLQTLFASARPLPESELRPPLAPARPTWFVELAMALSVGLVTYLVSYVVAPQVMQPNNFGEMWQNMSRAPFAFVGDFPHRLLGPLIAHYVGMGGALWVPFTQITAVVFLCLVFRVARWRGSEVVDAVLITFAVALTGAIQIYKAEMRGYVDNLGYSLTLLTWMSARRTLVFWPLILLNLTNHEMVGFFLPWFLFLRRQAGTSIRADIVGLVVVLGLYVAFRKYVGAHAPAWLYDGDYFLDHLFLPFSFVWLWLLAAIHQLQMFGPILAIVLWHAWRMQPNYERMHTLLIVGGFMTIFFVAYDVNRHSNMIFIPLLVASARFLGTRRSRFAYLALLGATVGVGSYAGWLFTWMTQVMIFDCGGHYLILPENRYNLLLEWEVGYGTFVRAWHVLFALAWEALFIVALARWLARRNFGGASVTTAGLLHPPMPGGAIAVFRRATSALWHRPRRRGPKVGT